MTTIYAISPRTLHRVEGQILGCWTCSETASVPLASVLDSVTGRVGAEADYVLFRTLRCPNCGARITEETLVNCEPSIPQCD